MSNGGDPPVIKKQPAPISVAVPVAAATAAPAGGPGSGAPPPGATPRSRAAMLRQQAGSTTFKENIFRVLVVVLLVGSLVLIWFVHQRLLVPAQKRSRDLSAVVSRLSSEVDEMERRWNNADAARLETTMGEVQNRIITGPAALETWVNALTEQTQPLALDVKPSFGNTVVRDTSDRRLALILTTIKIETKPAPGVESIQSPYQRILRLTHQLLAREQRADLVELSVVATPAIPMKADLVLNLWAGEEQREEAETPTP